MKKWLGGAVLLGGMALAGGVIPAPLAMAADALQQPAWAYGVPPPNAPIVPAARDDGTRFNLPDTDRTFTLNKIRGRRDNDTPARVAPADWYPSDHPYMPKIVAEGDEARGITACSLCHYPNGKGRSENAGPAGLPAAYLVRQLHDMRDDLRQSAERRKANAQQMVGFAKAMTEEEIHAAAAYFASMPWTPWIQVVESDTVPKTRSQGGMWLPLEGAAAGLEPLGDRLIEMPMHTERTESLRDPHSGFLAFVPVGAVAKGKELVAGGGGKTLPCAICHGADLNGVGSIPGIAARSPSYLARQLNDMRQGTRHGDMAALMKPVVAKLSDDDILNIVAYVASLPAPAPKQSAQAQ